MKKVLLLGASGSIGKNALAVIRDFPDALTLSGAHVHQNQNLLQSLHREYPHIPTLLSASVRGSLKAAYTALIEAAQPDIIVNGIAGSPGLLPSTLALEAGLPLALANKESIVMGGPFLLETAKQKGVQIIPVDSEHSALFQLLKGFSPDSVAELILTASGGPFWGRTKESLRAVTISEALAHPTWKMGGKISIDSATLANKGLELIEAMYLFGIEEDRIKVLVHPESMVHSLIRRNNGVLYAQVSRPDMREPIQAALFYPQVAPSAYGTLDLAGQSLTFHEPDTETFPLLALARMAARKKGAYPLAFNAANEIAVSAFQTGRIPFLKIADLVEETLSYRDHGVSPHSLEDILYTHEEIQNYSQECVKKI